MTRFDVNQIIMPLYIDSAQLYLQLSIGAIALSIAFKEKVIGEGSKKSVSGFLVLSWLLFLSAIGLSAFYQYLAVKFLDKISEHPGGTYYFEKLVDAPGIVYGAMLICFFAGATFLVISSTVQLIQREEND